MRYLLCPFLLMALLGCESHSTPTAAVIVAPPKSAPPVKSAETKAKPAALSAPTPRAVTPLTEFKFEVMEMHAQGTYQFTVRNGGDAPLKLEVGGTSCKCTAGAVEGKPIEPGETTLVTMQWNTGSQTGYYRQWATIKTNDPARREISFYVEGPIRNDFRCLPDTLELGEFVPGERLKTLETVIDSDRNEKFEIARAIVSDPAFKVDVEPLDPAEAKARDAVRGFRLKITPPEKLPKGDIQHVLQIAVKARPDSEEIQEFTLPIEGRVLGKIAVAGPKLNEFGWIVFGAKSHGVGAKTNLKVVVRDEIGELNVKQLKVQPEFLKVELKPAAASSGKVYDLLVEVPPDAPPCAHRGDNMAKIHFEFDHPRIPKLDLKVDFSVRAPREFP
jgi:hypothetical protein